MPLYDGETLQARLKRGRLPFEDAAPIAMQVARGLGTRTTRGIVHRDIKPSNVMLLTDGTVKILDFGIAKMDDLSLGRPSCPLRHHRLHEPRACARGGPIDHRGRHLVARRPASRDARRRATVRWRRPAGRGRRDSHPRSRSHRRPRIPTSRRASTTCCAGRSRSCRSTAIPRWRLCRRSVALAPGRIVASRRDARSQVAFPGARVGSDDRAPPCGGARDDRLGLRRASSNTWRRPRRTASLRRYATSRSRS